MDTNQLTIHIQVNKIVVEIEELRKRVQRLENQQKQTPKHQHSHKELKKLNE